MLPLVRKHRTALIGTLIGSVLVSLTGIIWDLLGELVPLPLYGAVLGA